MGQSPTAAADDDDNGATADQHVDCAQRHRVGHDNNQSVNGQPHDFVAGLALDIHTVAGDSLVGVYLHGSAVLGGWRPTTSDVDVLVLVVDECAHVEVSERIAAALASAAAGLEASVVEARAAAMPATPWPYVVHVTTDPTPDRKIVWGGGDPDLILHYEVARTHGWAAYGPPPASVIGPYCPHDRARSARAASSSGRSTKRRSRMRC